MTFVQGAHEREASHAFAWWRKLGSRGNHVAHLTFGYGDKLPEERRPIPPFRFHVGAVCLVESKTGQSEHVRLDRWVLG